MLRGIWKSIGKSQRYLSIYHAVPDNNSRLEKWPSCRHGRRSKLMLRAC